jgi:Flp pilus assembly protein TadD
MAGEEGGSAKSTTLSLDQAFALAFEHYRADRLDEARALYEGILKLRPDHADTLHCLGALAFRQSRFEDSVHLIIESLTHNPSNAEAEANLGSALSRTGRQDEALKAYQRALEMDPDRADLRVNTASLLRALDRPAEAAVHYEAALALQPDHAEAARNFGATLRELGRTDEAIAALETAAKARPGDAVVHTNLAIALLEAGRFEEGWREYEWRFASKGVERGFAQPLWDGGAFEGETLLVHAEQGLGDTIQFVRYLPRVKQRGGTVLLECQPALMALFDGLAGADAIVAHGASLPDFDRHCPLLGLPRRLGTTLETIPAAVSYLAAPKGRKPGRLPAAKGKLRVGLVWAGAAGHVNDRHRSIPLARFKPLATLDGVQLVSLQVGERAADLAEQDWAGSVVDLAGAFTDIADTAALMGRLDLIVSVDTAPAHLAGALGLPVWLLLPFKPDWRWMRERDDSPWYPTMRLFRQKKPGDWPAVIQRLRRALIKAAE